MESIEWSSATKVNDFAGTRHLPRGRGWQEYAERFPEDTDCLASFLALECAEVLQRAKPANLLNLSNRPRLCGKNLYRLWKEHGETMVRGTGLSVRVLADRGSSILLLLYRHDALHELLSRNSVKVILSRAGYSETGELERILDELQTRVQGTTFPHEIGVFLGYPLKDVVGFIGWPGLAFTCQGPWKIFGDPKESLKLAARHRLCRCKISLLLDSGCDPRECLKGVSWLQRAAHHSAAPN
ncbi:DUF3793 family protein [Geomonas sp. RF6]|uniref:DUF3793 family protein n=1 Tax=Geomonas sp. RF6 TaxID=2897342 RepID=UPI001E2F99DE|nr:DUF3793 family protein [Geomonas sp. RF6]UFS70817.1 DUF3793 family protein [Geomonas sp. RF6]